MAVFILEDLTGTVETIVFPRDYVRFEPVLVADTPVIVSGRFDVDEDNTFKLVASDIQPLQGFAQRNARVLHVRVPVAGLGPDAATQLFRLFERNRGETGVDVELYQPRDFRVTIHSSDFVKVRSSPELIQQIEGICGADSVQVLN